MRVGFFQFRPRFGQIEANCDRVVGALQRVEADLLVLPELPFTGYFFRSRSELRRLAEDPARSPIVERLRALCRERGMTIVDATCPFVKQAQDCAKQLEDEGYTTPG